MWSTPYSLSASMALQYSAVNVGITFEHCFILCDLFDAMPEVYSRPFRTLSFENVFWKFSHRVEHAGGDCPEYHAKVAPGVEIESCEGGHVNRVTIKRTVKWRLPSSHRRDRTYYAPGFEAICGCESDSRHDHLSRSLKASIHAMPNDWNSITGPRYAQNLHAFEYGVPTGLRTISRHLHQELILD